jgi:hypothetical protein
MLKWLVSLAVRSARTGRPAKITEFDPYRVGLTMLYAAAIRGHHWIIEPLLRHSSPPLTRKLWNVALKCSYITASPPLAKRAKAVVLSFSLISETFGSLPDGWSAHKTKGEKDNYYVNVDAKVVTWQDPRIYCQPEDSMDVFWQGRRPPQHKLSPNLKARLDRDYDISAPPSSDELDLDT